MGHLSSPARTPAQLRLRKVSARCAHAARIAAPIRDPARLREADTFVLEADIRYPTDINLIGDAVRTRVRVAGQAMEAVPGETARSTTAAGPSSSGSGKAPSWPMRSRS